MSPRRAASSKGGNHRPLVLLVLDGWGLAPAAAGNAITSAKKPNFDRLWRTGSHTTLTADGKAVGLPTGHVGNSEAGHINLGAGRVVDQEIVLISKDINTGKFFKNSALESAYRHVVKHKSRLHVMGLLSNGQSGHSNPDHLLALVSWARKKNISKVFLHLFTDGRDSAPHSGLKQVEALMRGLKNKQTGSRLSGEWIATLMGRYYAMDRKKDWPRTELAYNAMVLGVGKRAPSPQAAITQSYNRKETDEFIPPYVLTRNGKPLPRISHRDAVIFYNLRSDRARQLSKPFVQKEFTKQNPGSFTRKKVLKQMLFVAMTDFGPDLDNIFTAYPSDDIRDSLPMALGNLRQLYIAEREKYAHVTFFFNGGYADPVAGEDRIVIPSPDVANYAEKPAMSTQAVADNIIEAVQTHDFICANFANADMVGHTGDFAATVQAVETIDDAIGKIAKAVKQRGGTLIVTADHGNAEQTIDPQTGEIDTEHNPSPVPFLLVEPKGKRRSLRRGVLGDVAPTVLKLLKIPKPKLMTGKPLF